METLVQAWRLPGHGCELRPGRSSAPLSVDGTIVAASIAGDPAEPGR
ncbi:hypothetical protein [Streptosporangium subroseum]|nr:hypothetical protein [Streptosporangium subroseum]